MFSSKTTTQSLIILSTALLLCISVLMVFSTTAVSSNEQFGRTTTFLNKHVVQILLGVISCALCSRIRAETWQRLAFPLLALSALLLLVVLLPGVGHTAGGATRWLVFGPLRFQPGELAKFAVVLFIASYIGRQHHRMYSFLPGVVVPLMVVTGFAVMLLLQPDFGSTSIILAVVFVQLLMVARLLHLVSVGAAAAAVLATLVIISPYRFKRVEAFLDPFHDASAAGYQLVQSLIAVGSGGVVGEGLGAGKQKLYYLPAAHTDFIFAVISEELGLVGAASVVALFLLLAFAGFGLARRLAAEPFHSALAVGCTSLIVVPAFLNMGVVLGILPTKGLVLPLVAYGGTAMIINLAVLGVLLSLAREHR